MQRIAVVGDIAVDHYIWMAEGQLAQEKSQALRSQWLLGGTAANAAVTISRLGSKVSLFGNVGTDPWGQWVVDQVSAEGVDSSNVEIVSGLTTNALILFQGDRRSIVVDQGVAKSPLSALNFDRLEEFDLIYCSYSPDTALQLAKNGLAGRVILGFEPWMDSAELRSRFSDFRLVILNSAGLVAVGGWDRRSTVLETIGERGVNIFSTSLESHVPAVRVEAVDATGAGDAFAGAVCHSLALGSDLAEAVELAVSVAAAATTQFGAQTSAGRAQAF